MLKKDLGLFLLILVVGTVVAIINPRFLSPINLSVSLWTFVRCGDDCSVAGVSWMYA